MKDHYPQYDVVEPFFLYCRSFFFLLLDLGSQNIGQDYYSTCIVVVAALLLNVDPTYRYERIESSLL